MSAASLARRGRVMHLTIMDDQCTIERPGQMTTTDDGRDVQVPVSVYTGRCRVVPTGRAATTDKTGNVIFQTWDFNVMLPISLVSVNIRDTVTITRSEDASLVGKKLRVDSIERGTHATARRLQCSEVAR